MRERQDDWAERMERMDEAVRQMVEESEWEEALRTVMTESVPLCPPRLFANLKETIGIPTLRDCKQRIATATHTKLT